MTIPVSMKNNVPAPPSHVLLDWALAKDVKQAKAAGIDNRVDMERAVAAAAELENRHNSRMFVMLNKLSTDRRRRRTMCICALGTLIIVIALAMVLLFAVPKSDDNATAAGLTSGDGMQSPFIVIPLNTTENVQTRAAHKCAEKHSWLDSIGLCGAVGTMQNWFGWGDDSNPYDSMLTDDNTSIDKNHLCVMPCSDGSGDYGVCLCQRPSLMSAFRDDAQCECPLLGRSTAVDAASDDGGVDGRAMNHSPSNDDDALTPFFDDLFDDGDDSITNPDSPDTPSADNNRDGGDTYMLITDENTGTSCLLHCPHLTHFHWPGETRRVLNCREYVQLMSPDLCDVVDTSS